MMLLAKMEDYGSLFPSLCTDNAFSLIECYDNRLYGRKKKKKEIVDVSEFRLDSPCNSPEVIISGGVDDTTKRCPKFLHSDIVTDTEDHAAITLCGVDMEGFCEISATMTASEDIMLSSGFKESKLLLKEVTARPDLSKLTVEDLDDASRNGRSAFDCSALQTAYDSDVDALVNSTWRNKELGLAAPSHDLLPDLSALAVSGYLLSDIPSHPDLSCEAGESVNSLLTYCTDKDEECLNSCSPLPQKDLLNDIKCEENSCRLQDPCEAVYSDFDASCTDPLLDAMQSDMSDYRRSSSCQCQGHDCLCYKSDTSSADEGDVCIEYIVSHQRPAKVTRQRGRRAHVARRGPGRPRKLQNVDFVRRGPGRPRKKSISDAYVWYQTRRKRTVSFSSGCKSRNKQKSISDDRDAQNLNKRAHVHDSATDKFVKAKRSCRGEDKVRLSDDQPTFGVEILPLQSSETDIGNVLLHISLSYCRKYRLMVLFAGYSNCYNL